MPFRQFHLRVKGQTVAASVQSPELEYTLQDVLPPPVFTVEPSISGAAAVGVVLTLNRGTVINGAVTSAELLRGATVIADNPGETYTPVTADIGASLFLRVTATGLGGEVVATSLGIGPIGETLPAQVGTSPLFIFPESGIVADDPSTVSTDTKRFKLTASGFTRVSGASDPRTAYRGATYLGNFMQTAGNYVAMPLDDTAQPNGATDPVRFNPSVGTDTVIYPGAHSEPDIFGTTGKGVILRQGATGSGINRAPNVALTGVQVGDVIRQHVLVAIDSPSAGTINLRMEGGTGSVTLNFTHDTTKVTGFTFSGLSQAGFYNLPFLINGKQWTYIWWNRIATGTANSTFGLAYVGTVEGRELHICSWHAERNPTCAPAAIPVTLSGAYTADTVNTGISSTIGFVLHGAGVARTRAASGVITPPAITIGLPYLPACNRIDAIDSTAESGDRWGIMPNENLVDYASPYQNPTNFAINYGPCRIQRDWLITASGKTCVNATIGSVFRARKDKRAILGRLGLSRTFMTGTLTVDDNIFLAQADSRISTYWEQNSNRSSGAASFDFQVGGGVSARNCLVMGQTLDTTRARYQIQKDRNWNKQVFVGEWLPQVGGGELNCSGSRFQYLSRVNLGGLGRTTAFTCVHNDVMALDMWSDPLILGAGTYSFEMKRCFYGHTTSYGDLYLSQSQREIHISTDGGATFVPFSASGLTIRDLPHGVTAEYVGTFNPGTGVVTYGTAANKGPLKFRYYESGSVTGFVNRAGFQIHMSQMDMGNHTRYPSDRDVFRTGVETGPTGIPMIVEHCYQSGRWTNASTWTNFTGANIGNPSLGSTGTHPDFLQVNRFDVVIGSAQIDGNVFIGKAQGMFLTGGSSLPANGSAMDNFVISNWVFLGEAINTVVWNHSLTNPADCSLENCIMLQGEQLRPFRFTDGSAGSVIIRSDGPRNVLTIAPGSDVTLASSSTSGGGAGDGAVINSIANVNLLPLSRVQNFTTYAPAANLNALNLVPAEWRKTGDRIRLPETSADARAFRFVSDIATRTNVDGNAIIETALGNHDEWDSIVTDLRGKYLGAPDKLAVIPNSTAVGTVIATGLTGTGFKLGEGGNDVDGLYEIVSGELRIAKPLTGLNRIDVLLSNADELLVVDITT